MKMKYHPEKDLPDFARQYKTLSPSKLAEIVLMRRNKKVTPESITMWFKRHPEVYDALTKEIITGLPTAREEVDTSIFEYGNFESLRSVKDWIIRLNARSELSEEYKKDKITALRRVCMGKVHTFDLVAEGKWAYKHPDRLTPEDCLEFFSLLTEKKIDPYPYKRDLKDFMESKGYRLDIKVGHARGKGKYADIYFPMEKLNAMLQFLKDTNFEAYVLDTFMFETGTRITASLTAKIKDITVVGNRGILRVYDKAIRAIHPEGKPWDKYLKPSLISDMAKLIGIRLTGKPFNLEELEKYVETRPTGTVFTIKENVINKINKALLERFIPELFKEHADFDEYNHFWRHMFAQHMLRKTNWNYAIVASLGGWTPQALEESYGKPKKELVREWAEKYGWE
jgi:integrase